MNAAGVAEAVIQKLEDPEIDFIFANFANIDVVGHIENEKAIEKAVETVDFHLGRVLELSRKEGVIALVTADHGTVEKWLYPDGSIDTGHTNSPVPFILVGPTEEENPPGNCVPRGNCPMWPQRFCNSLACPSLGDDRTESFDPVSPR